MPAITDFISRREILGIFAGLKGVPLFLRDSFFRGTKTTLAEVVSFLMTETSVTVAPYGTRGSESDNVSTRTGTWMSYRIPLINIFDTITAQDISELGPLNMLSVADLIGDKSAGLENQIRAAIEVACAEAMFSRQINFPQATTGNAQDPIAYPLAADLQDTDNWTNASTANPFGKIEALASVVQDNGFLPDTVVMNGTTFAKLQSTDAFKEAKLTTTVLDTAMVTQYREQGVAYRGSINGLDYFTYQVLSGATKKVPDGKVLIASRSGSRGQMVYGGVSDVAQTSPAERFVLPLKHNESAGSYELRVKSAPLPVKIDLNDSAILTVTIA